MQLAKRMGAITPFYVMELLHRAKQLEAQGRYIIHMEIGEPNSVTPKLITQAGIDYLKKGNVNYTPTSGLPELRQKMVTDLTRDNTTQPRSNALRHCH